MNPIKQSQQLAGVRVVYIPLLPKIQISPTFKWIPDRDRLEINLFLLATFGYREFRDEVIYDSKNNILYVPPNLKGQVQDLLAGKLDLNKVNITNSGIMGEF